MEILDRWERALDMGSHPCSLEISLIAITEQSGLLTGTVSTSLCMVDKRTSRGLAKLAHVITWEDHDDTQRLVGDNREDRGG